MKKILLLPLSIMLFAFSGWAQQKSVSGTILDENGGPLPIEFDHDAIAHY